MEGSYALDAVMPDVMLADVRKPIERRSVVLQSSVWSKHYQQVSVECDLFDPIE